MDRAANVIERLRVAAFVDDDVGLVKRLAAIERNGEQGQLVLVLDIRIVANPGGVELTRQKHGGDLVVGATLDQRDRPREPSRDIALHHREKLDVVIQKQGSKAETESFRSARRRKPPERRGGRSAQ